LSLAPFPAFSRWPLFPGSAAGGTQGPARPPPSTPKSRSATPPALVATTDFSPGHRLAPAPTPWRACTYDVSVSPNPAVARLDLLLSLSLHGSSSRGLEMATTFADLWRNHPSNDSPPENAPCRKSDGSPAFSNECCIRLGECLTRSGIDLSPFRGACCWYGHGKRHPLRVEEFKYYIDSEHASFAPYYAEKYIRTRAGHQVTYHRFLRRTGIVAFRNFWGRGDQGDHIDLWNGSRIAHGGLDYFVRSEQVWFWYIP